MQNSQLCEHEKPIMITEFSFRQLMDAAHMRGLQSCRFLRLAIVVAWGVACDERRAVPLRCDSKTTAQTSLQGMNVTKIFVVPRHQDAPRYRIPGVGFQRCLGGCQ